MNYLIVLLLVATNAYAADYYSGYTKYVLTEKEVAVLSETETILNQLKDPDSLRFRNKKIRAMRSEYGVILRCTEINAKNSYGAYGDPMLLVFSIRNGVVDYATIADLNNFSDTPVCVAAAAKWSE